ncbi:Pescadillo [Portunus trituberculatus]|uniref:Pescadillo n=1 Tax=Portunus trituberculatus TaxID=210409 RepID=A0A5B7GUW7_PORTR|nr:Pescadillo [Portunus trituberculatus]
MYVALCDMPKSWAVVWWSSRPILHQGLAGQGYMVNMCRRLTLEFMLYVIEAQALRKVFITIKGYYYQVEIMGQTITWITPHPFTPQTTTGVDFRIMRVFVEFYITLLGFTNFRLYHHLNLHYPPTLPHADIKVPSFCHQTEGGEDDVEMGDPERLASLNFPLKRNHVEDSNESETIDTHLLREKPHACWDLCGPIRAQHLATPLCLANHGLVWCIIVVILPPRVTPDHHASFCLHHALYSPDSQHFIVVYINMSSCGDECVNSPAPVVPQPDADVDIWLDETGKLCQVYVN